MTGQDKVSYTWKVDGPDNDDPGSRFDPSVELLDPWAKAVTNVLWERSNKNSRSMRAMVLPESDYNWEGDEPLRQSSEKEIIYELHVGGFTRHPSSEVAHPGSCLHLEQSGARGRYVRRRAVHGATNVKRVIMAFGRKHSLFHLTGYHQTGTATGD